jgi:hypothetical protein
VGGLQKKVHPPVVDSQHTSARRPTYTRATTTKYARRVLQLAEAARNRSNSGYCAVWPDAVQVYMYIAYIRAYMRTVVGLRVYIYAHLFRLRAYIYAHLGCCAGYGVAGLTACVSARNRGNRGNRGSLVASGDGRATSVVHVRRVLWMGLWLGWGGAKPA